MDDCPASSISFSLSVLHCFQGKNYLFCGNDASAYRAAIVYSLISTCKAADVDPRTWVEDVLRKIPYYQSDQRDLASPEAYIYADSDFSEIELR